MKAKDLEADNELLEADNELLYKCGFHGQLTDQLCMSSFMGNVAAHFGKPVVISRDEQEESGTLFPLQARIFRHP